MFDLLERIVENSTVTIMGKKYTVLAKVKYVTETETEKWYVKIQLENHHVLVIAPFDDCMYFGYVGKAFPCSIPGPDSIEYNGAIYNKEAVDYQIVKEFIFGDCLSMEGEVRYADFACDDHLISIGEVVRTGKRADVYAKYIGINDIQIVQ